MNKTNIDANSIYLRKVESAPDAEYRAFSKDGALLATISKGWTRLGGLGWVAHLAGLELPVRGSFKNLESAKRDIAHTLNKLSQ